MKADPLIMGVWCHDYGDYVRRVGRYALDALPCSFAPYAKTLGRAPDVRTICGGYSYQALDGQAMLGTDCPIGKFS